MPEERRRTTPQDLDNALTREKLLKNRRKLLTLQRRIGMRVAFADVQGIHFNRFGQLQTAAARHLEDIFGENGEHVWTEVEAALRKAGVEEEHITPMTQAAVKHVMQQVEEHREEAETRIREHLAQAEQGVKNAEDDAEYARRQKLRGTAEGLKAIIREWAKAERRRKQELEELTADEKEVMLAAKALHDRHQESKP
ncbi:hypothetical protein HY572_04480 [Candidatus Micrarchaeota archaeon]|nr:hypothetical protein [Candidatus Micrarchaeota archaeon]